MDEGSEQDLGTGGLRKSHPEDENEFKGVVERCRWLAATRGIWDESLHTEPVDRTDHALEDG